MKSSIQGVRGMNDLHGKEISAWQEVERLIHEIFSAYGFREFRTPILEQEILFRHSVGEETDIVSKEMYTILQSESDDARPNNLVMRPEGTASIVRAFIEHKKYTELPQKYYYIGPMFRKERPQKGRLRQFHQYGFEVFGPSGPGVDAECMSLVKALFDRLGLKNYVFHINSMGDKNDRKIFRERLLQFLLPLEKKLSPTSQKRLHTNPLRILDSKDESDRKICEKAPSIIDCLQEDSLKHWQIFLKYCAKFDVPIIHNKFLVRGLDYYTRTVFEVIDTGENLGSQNALGGGGRYDSLCAELGGPELPAFGFAGGMERLLLALPQNSPVHSKSLNPDLCIIDPGEREHFFAIKLVAELRKNGLGVDWDADGGKSFKALFKRADRMKASYALILGENEFEKGILKVKNMQNGTENFAELGKNFSLIELKEITKTLRHLIGK